MSETTTIGLEEINGIMEAFAELPDPRDSVNQKHLLSDVIAIAMLAVCSGADGPSAIEEWAKARHEQLKEYLRLPNGIPSHDTIGRVLQLLNPAAFESCFSRWLRSVLGLDEETGSDVDKHYAIDGKALRGSHNGKEELGPLYLVSVWATEQGISLGQVAIEEKSNEIKAIPEVLDQVDVSDTTVTIDAAGCQKDIAKKIIDQGGDYVLALKMNHPTFYEAVSDYITGHMEDDFARVNVSRYETNETKHGRKEHRTYYQLDAPKDLPGFANWKGLKTIGVAVNITERDGKETCEVRYYISSHRRNAKKFARFVRKHWAIENTLHWSLDVTFREDDSRIRERNVARNIAWLRRIAISILKQHDDKRSLAMRRRVAGWNFSYLMQVIMRART